LLGHRNFLVTSTAKSSLFLAGSRAIGSSTFQAKGLRQMSTKPSIASPRLPRALIYRTPGSIQINERNARVHSKRQIQKIAKSIAAFGHIVPIVVDEKQVVLKGHATLEAAKFLGLATVPTITVSGLSDSQKRAFMIADNRLAQDAGWNYEVLGSEFEELSDLLRPIDLDLSITGFDPAEIDIILRDHGPTKPDPGDAIPAVEPNPVARPGDLWRLRDHHILCGDARSAADLDRLLAEARARLVFTDPPYNVRIAGHVQGRGRVKHREFAFASGEMTDDEYVNFLSQSCRNIARVCVDGAIAFICTDWRHFEALLKAARTASAELKNVIVWNKTSPGQGTFYRSQHELILAWKVGSGPHINAFELGQHGRMRSNVWTYPGANSFRAGRHDELAMHPTLKPVALVADAIRDCSLKGDLVLDVFLGSGTTIMAAEKVGRRGFGMEYDPAYVDVSIRRWQQYTRADAVLLADGRTFREVEAERRETEKARSAAMPAGTQTAPGNNPKRHRRDGRRGYHADPED
jgi:DNA modification methylase